MNIFDLLESPGMGRPHDTKGIQSAADQSAASPIGSGTTKHEAKKKPVTMMGKNIKEGFDLGGVKNWLLKLKQGLSTEAEETKAMFDTYVRYTQGQASEQEMAAANEQFKDLLRGLGMGTLAAMPGSVVTLPLVFKLAKKFNIELMPSAFKNDVEEAAVKPNFKMPPESLQDKMYRQHQELRKQRGAPSPEEYKERIAQKQAEIDALKEGILDRGTPGLPKPRNPADQVLRSKVNAGGRHLDKKRRQDLNPKHKNKDPLAESTGKLNWTVHFDDGTSQQVTVPSDEFDVRGYFAKQGKKVVKIDYSFAAQDRQDAPRRSTDDPAAHADSLAKAQSAYDRGLTEQENVSESQAVKITDYDIWSDEVKALGGEIHPQKDRNLLVAQSWDGEEIGKFHLGKSMGFINQSGDLDETIRKMGSQYRLLSKKGKNLGTFDSKAGAEKHEREVQYFKHKSMEEGRHENDPKHVYDIIKYAMADAEKTGQKVVRSIGGFYKLAPLDDPRPALVPNTERKNKVAELQAEIDDLERIRLIGYENPDEYKKLYYRKYGPHHSGPGKLASYLKKQIRDIPYAVEKELAEGWKGKLAGAALAGAAALGSSDVDAQNINLPGPQAVMMAHIVADVNGREVNKTVNLGTQYQSKEQAEQDLEEYMQSKGITRYSIRVEQSYEQPGTGYSQGRRTSGYATGGYSATGPISAPGLGDMIAGKVSREIRAGIPDRGGYATGGTNQGQRPRDGSQWWKDQLPRIKEDTLEEDIESHLYLMSRAGYDIVQEAWSDKYKDSINCSNPKGFSQKAHCAGKKKNEGVSEEKVRLDPKCWKGKKIGNPKTKMKGGVRVNNCVPK